MVDEKIKIIFELDEEITHLKKIDQKKRVHGSNAIYIRLEQLANSLKILLLGECEYGKDNWCDIICDTCDNIDKENCALRMEKKRQEKMKPKELLLSDTTFTKIDGYKQQNE